MCSNLIRFIADPCPNAFGSIFDQMVEMGPIMDEMVATGRGAVFYYEHLQVQPAMTL